jgi:hypothetical protein
MSHYTPPKSLVRAIRTGDLADLFKRDACMFEAFFGTPPQFPLLLQLSLDSFHTSCHPTHVAIYGNQPKIGLSRILDLIQRILIPGTVFRHIIAKNEQREMERKPDGEVHLYDVLPVKYLLYGRSCTTREIGFVMGATNLNPEYLPTPTQSRFCFIDISPWEEIQTTFINRSLIQQCLIQEKRDLQYLISGVELLIETRVLPDVNLDLCKKIWRRILFDLPTMDTLRIKESKYACFWNHLRALVVYDAVTRVFYTTQHFLENKEFRPDDFLQVRPYLIGTREHFELALNQLAPYILLNDVPKGMAVEDLVKMTLDLDATFHTVFSEEF